MKRYNHWIVEKIATGERSEIIKQGTLKDFPGYKVIGCCGFHEVKGSNKNEKENKKYSV